MAAKYIAPPTLVPEKYTSWRKGIKILQMATNILKKRAPTMFLCLPEKAKEAIMKMDAELLNRDNGLDQMFEKLVTLYKEDENEAALISYDKFE